MHNYAILNPIQWLSVHNAFDNLNQLMSQFKSSQLEIVHTLSVDESNQVPFLSEMGFFYLELKNIKEYLYKIWILSYWERTEFTRTKIITILITKLCRIFKHCFLFSGKVNKSNISQKKENNKIFGRFIIFYILHWFLFLHKFIVRTYISAKCTEQNDLHKRFDFVSSL